jgi:hypothetical protein
MVRKIIEAVSERPSVKTIAHDSRGRSVERREMRLAADIAAMLPILAVFGIALSRPGSPYDMGQLVALAGLASISMMSSRIAIWNILCWRFDHAECLVSNRSSALLALIARTGVPSLIAMCSDGLIIRLAFPS